MEVKSEISVSIRTTDFLALLRASRNQRYIMGLSKAQLLAELTENNEFFDMMVDMIPKKLYVSPRKLEEEGEQVVPAANTRYYRHQSKAETKEVRRAAAKVQKRRKLDPSTSESTSKFLQRLEDGKTLLPPPKVVTPTQSTKNAQNQSRIEALRERLHAKIAEKQAQNPRYNKDPNQISKRAARRAEKERRREEAKKRKAAAPSAAEKKANNPRYTVSSQVSRAADLAQLDFGRLAGLNEGPSSVKKNYEQSNKALQNLSKSKNLHKMLADAEAKRDKLEELKQGNEEDQAKARQMQWSDTFKEADGQRMKDDPAKLKKQLKRKAAKKAKSQKAWQSRTAQTDKKLQDKQKIRQHNLQARKQGGQVGANLSRKEIRTPEEDSGRRLSRAGFEGRKRDFLNSGGGGKKSSNKDQ